MQGENENLGATKLRFFGVERIKQYPGIETGDLGLFFDVLFSAKLLAKAAVIMDVGADRDGRGFVACLLCQKLIEEFTPDETFGNTPHAGSLYLFEDNTFRVETDTGRLFSAQMFPGRGVSLPNDLQSRTT